MTEPERHDKTFEILLKQLEMCWADKRNYETMVWQTPTISIGIIAILLAGILSIRPFDAPNLFSSSLILVGTLLTLGVAFGIGLVGFIQLRKQWFFVVTRTHDIDGIRLNLTKFGQAYPVKFRTREVKDNPIYYRTVPQGWSYAQEAHNWLDGLMIVILVALVAMIVLLVARLLIG